ncbi:MAG: shikimate kinase [Bacteroidetes bacterium]|nr:MAG: shikimate kinase [Bacteroidota bacterium]
MGSGKTTVGKKLARLMNRAFVDLDRQIEKDENQSIEEIFEAKGEDVFRELERKALHQTFDLKNTVISLGGGTPCFYDNLEQINAHGIGVYLKLSATSLAHRLQQSKTPRPLIKNLSDGELFEYVQQQLGERERFYNRTHIIIKGENLKVTELYNVIKEYL